MGGGEKNCILLLALILIFASTISCEHSEVAVRSHEGREEFPLRENLMPPTQIQEIPLLMTYHLDSLENAAEVDSFKTRYTARQQEFIYALNRMDAYRLGAGDKIIIPDTLTTNFLDYSPFPLNFEMLNSIPKTVLVSRRVQGFALYENGKLIKWGPVSSGKKSTPTPAGLFYGNYKARSKISTVNNSWLMPYYFNFMNFEGVGVHQYSLPGYPASHACVRLRKADAAFIYNWARQWQLDPTGQVIMRNGTPFMVFGKYNFDKHVPWFDLAEAPNSNYLSAEEMETLRNYITEYKRDMRNFDLPLLHEEVLSAPPPKVLETIQ